MKELFSYTLPLKQKQEITETLPNGDKITKSVDKESLVKIIIKEPSRKEIQEAKISERGATRMDDKVSEAAMEDRKKGGYF